MYAEYTLDRRVEFEIGTAGLVLCNQTAVFAKHLLKLFANVCLSMPENLVVIVSLTLFLFVLPLNEFTFFQVFLGSVLRLFS